ncbi:hypothetical protein ACVWVZ_004762 [Pseudomonas tolaasii]
MTFKADHNEHSGPYNGPAGAICFNCNRPLEGSSVCYDGYVSGDGPTGISIYMHTECAMAVAQRLICDAWPNRRSGKYIKVS